MSSAAVLRARGDAAELGGDPARAAVLRACAQAWDDLPIHARQTYWRERVLLDEPKPVEP